MSNDDHASFKKIENYGFRITVLQAITLFSVLFAVGSWYKGRDEKQLIDGDRLNVKIDNVLGFFKNSRAKDSIIAHQNRFIDSVALDKKLDAKFKNFRSEIAYDINRKLITTDKRLQSLEKRMKFSFVQEIKKKGPKGPVTVNPVDNR